MKVLSIIIPSYNEAKTLPLILSKIISVNLPDDVLKDIIIIDDCSIDETASVVSDIIRSYPDEKIRYIKLEKNRGKGYAVRTGIQHSIGDIVIIQDADLEYEPNDYNQLITPILEGKYKVVYGSRILNKNNKFSYFSFYWGGRLISLFTRILFGQHITDEPTCYKVFDSQLIKAIPLSSDRFGFCPEVTAKLLKLGYKIKELPIHYYPRSKQEGKKIKWKDGVEALYLLFKYRFDNNWIKQMKWNNNEK